MIPKRVVRNAGRGIGKSLKAHCSIGAQGRVVESTGHTAQRLITDGGIRACSGVVSKRKCPHSNIRAHGEAVSRAQRAAGGVIYQGVIADCRVAVRGVVCQRLITYSGVAAAGDVVIERINAVGSVPNAVAIVKEGLQTGGCVASAGGVAKKRKCSIGRVPGSCVIAEECP